MIRAGAPLLLLLLAAATGCRSRPVYRVAHPPFHQGDVRTTYESIVEDGDNGIAPEDEALWRNELGTAALCLGDEETALRSFKAAGATMGTLTSTSSENARAIFGEEATKVYRGDPYERSMNAFYQGILYYRERDLDRASAAFKRGLLADGWSEVGEHQVDFAALSFLLGWTSYHRGKQEQARYSFAEASEHMPENPHLREPRPDGHNVLVVAGIGMAPFKYAGGPYGSVAQFQPADYPERGIDILVDGKRAGRSEMATNLFHQAITRGDRLLDGIRKGKAVFKGGSFIAGEILLVEALDSDRSSKSRGGLAAAGLALLAVSALTRPEADTRHWALLPGEVHVLPLRIEPGPHDLEVRALDPQGRPIAGWSRRFRVHVPASGDTLYYFRTLPGGQIAGLTDDARSESERRLGRWPGMALAKP